MSENGLLSIVSDGTPVLPHFTAISWDVPANISYEEWDASLGWIAVNMRATQWWLGDGLLAAQERGKEFWERGIQRAAELGFKPQTCLNAMSVARKFIKPNRYGSLTFSHHQVVRPLELPEANSLLEQAIADDWTVSETKEAVKKLKGGDANNGITSTSDASDSGNGNSPKPVDIAAAASVETGAAPLTAAEQDIYADGFNTGSREGFDEGYRTGLRKAIEIACVHAECLCDEAWKSRNLHEPNAPHEVAEEIVFAIEELLEKKP